MWIDCGIYVKNIIVFYDKRRLDTFYTRPVLSRFQDLRTRFNDELKNYNMKVLLIKTLKKLKTIKLELWSQKAWAYCVTNSTKKFLKTWTDGQNSVTYPRSINRTFSPGLRQAKIYLLRPLRQCRGLNARVWTIHSPAFMLLHYT